MPTQRKILTVVLLSASAGCGASASKSSAPTLTRVPVPEIAASPQAPAEPVATIQLVASTAPAPAPVAATPPVVARDELQSEETLRLRSELYRADDLTLNVAHAKFRALCDENGYPVVGNVASKSMRHDVSSYCADVRSQLVMR